MGFRAGLAKGPWVGPNAAGSSGGLTTIPTWVKFTVTHTQLQAAALTNNITLYSLPAGGLLTGCKIKHTVAFAGTGITGYTVSVGLAATLDLYMPAFDVFSAVSNTNLAISNVYDDINQGAATAIKIAATATGANLSLSTAGSVDVWLLLSKAT